MAQATKVKLDVNAIPDYRKLQGKNIVITGGAHGLGKAIALEYLKHGALVTIGDLDDRAGTRLALEHERLQFVRCDVREWTDQALLFRHAASRLLPCDPTMTQGINMKCFAGNLNGHGNVNVNVKRGKGMIDEVIANAGVAEIGTSVFDDDLDEPNLKTLDINLRAQFFTTKLAFYYLCRHTSSTSSSSSSSSVTNTIETETKGEREKKGSLILVGSIASIAEIPGAPQYTASKFGILGLMKSLATTTHVDGLRINSIHPWFVKTAIVNPGVRLLLAGTEYTEIRDVVRAVLLISCFNVNGSAIGIMAPEVGIVDLFEEIDGAVAAARSTVGRVNDFTRFRNRVTIAFETRSWAIKKWRFISEFIVGLFLILRVPLLWMVGIGIGILGILVGRNLNFI